eukprot:2597558-Ditylum_brightwellii.AAC.1
MRSYSPNMPPTSTPKFPSQQPNLGTSDKGQQYNRHSSTKARHDLIRQRPSSGDVPSKVSDSMYSKNLSSSEVGTFKSLGVGNGRP